LIAAMKAERLSRTSVSGMVRHNIVCGSLWKLLMNM